MAHQAIPRLGRILSLDPRKRTVAYAYFENGELCDCRVKSARDDDDGKHAKGVMPYITFLLDYYDPHAVLFPDIKATGTRSRSDKTGEILQALKRHVAKRGGAVHVLSNTDVKKWVVKPDGTAPENQREINREVLRRYPELVAVVPRPRSKPWHEEQHFTPLFNAVAMYLAFERQPTPNDIRDGARH